MVGIFKFQLCHGLFSVMQSLGGCNRCQMINLNSQGGELQQSNEPLATLAAYRRAKVSQIAVTWYYAFLVNRHFFVAV